MTDPWPLVSPTSALAIKYGKGLKESLRRPGPIPVYGSNGIIGWHDTSVTSGPTLIIGRKGSVGAVHLSNGPCWPIDTTYFVEDFGAMDPGFAAYALRSLRLESLDRSTAIPGISRSDFDNLSMPRPPIDEQRRIADKLDDLLGRVAATRERLDRVPAILRRFRQSVLAAAVSGRLTDEDGEPSSVTIAEIAELRGGIQKQPSRAPGANPRRYLTVAHVKRDLIDIEHPRFFEVSDDELERWRLLAGDVLVVEGNGSPTEIGRAAIFRGEIEDCVHQNHVIRVRPKSGVMNSEFLSLYLNSPAGQLEVQERSHTTAGLYSLSVGKIKDIRVPAWSLEAQNRIVGTARRALILASAAEVRAQNAGLRADNLVASILARAF